VIFGHLRERYTVGEQCSKQNKLGAHSPAQTQECLHPRCHQKYRVANTAQITSTPHLPAAAIPFLPPLFLQNPCMARRKFKRSKKKFEPASVARILLSRRKKSFAFDKEEISSPENFRGQRKSNGFPFHHRLCRGLGACGQGLLPGPAHRC